VKIRKAVIPAAGLGTRFLPATKAQPKEMLPLVDTPIIQHVVEEAVRSGIEDILIITGRGKRAIEDHFDRSLELEHFLEQSQKREYLEKVRHISHLADIHFIRQKEPRGLGHAILQARRHVGDEPFAVLLGDEVFVGDPPGLQELISIHERLGGTVIATRTVDWPETRRYGIIATDGVIELSPSSEAVARGDEQPPPSVYRVTDLVEKPHPEKAPSRQAIVGRYIIDPSIFSILEDLPPGYGGEIQLTDALRQLARQQPIYAAELRARRFDVGEKLGYLQATVEFALRDPELGHGFRAFLEELLNRERAREEAAAGREGN